MPYGTNLAEMKYLRTAYFAYFQTIIGNGLLIAMRKQCKSRRNFGFTKEGSKDSNFFCQTFGPL